MAPRKKPPAPKGRPSTFNTKDAAEIVARLSKGEPMAAICRDDWLPDASTVWRWTKANEAFSQSIAHAREMGFDAIALECLEIADETNRDTKAGPNGADVCNAEWISRSKLRVETRLKLLAKWDPKRYGDKLAVGGDPDGVPLQIALIERKIVDAHD